MLLFGFTSFLLLSWSTAFIYNYGEFGDGSKLMPDGTDGCFRISSPKCTAVIPAGNKYPLLAPGEEALG